MVADELLQLAWIILEIFNLGRFSFFQRDAVDFGGFLDSQVNNPIWILSLYGRDELFNAAIIWDHWAFPVVVWCFDFRKRFTLQKRGRTTCRINPYWRLNYVINVRIALGLCLENHFPLRVGRCNLKSPLLLQEIYQYVVWNECIRLCRLFSKAWQWKYKCIYKAYTLYINNGLGALIPLSRLIAHRWKMAKKKSSKKKNKKDSQLLIRISGEERDRFVELCEELDTSAAREIRKFIGQFLKMHEEKKDVWTERRERRKRMAKVSKKAKSIKKEMKSRKAVVAKQQGKIKKLKKALKKVWLVTAVNVFIPWQRRHGKNRDVLVMDAVLCGWILDVVCLLL